MGAGTPGGRPGRPDGPVFTDGPGIRPPEGGLGGPGIRPPESEPTPPRIDPPRTPNKGEMGPSPFGSKIGQLMEAIKQTDKFKDKIKEGGKGIGVPDKKSPEIFDKLLEGIKKTGKPFGGRGGKPVVSRPAPGSDIPLGPDDRPIGFGGPRDDSDFITEYGDTRDPNYAEKKAKAFEEKYGFMPKPEPFVPVNPRGSGPAEAGPRPRPFLPRDIGLGGGPGSNPPSFPRGPRDPRTMRGPRKEAVLFEGKPPSTESRRPKTRKAGPVDTETKNKFEEMLAYMKSFQR